MNEHVFDNIYEGKNVIRFIADDELLQIDKENEGNVL